jgi:hypothetical protein
VNDTEKFVADIQQLIAEHDDIRIVEVQTGGVSGYEDFVYLACGKSRARVFQTYSGRDGHCQGPSAEKQLADGKLIADLRQREAQRLADEEALQSTVARFYAESDYDQYVRPVMWTGTKRLTKANFVHVR